MAPALTDRKQVMPKPACQVKMIEVISGAHTNDSTGGMMDVKPLLKLMDIATCACAEKHTGVNCVTVSMGDVVFEHFPICGEMLELTTRPVYCGSTSLDISLVVISEGENGIRRRVCDAVFTYVTTRGPEGEKRYVPPLQCTSPGNGQTDWKTTVAKHRRALVKMEQANKPSEDDSHDLDGFDIEMTEVVLPAHQNHMRHTFGGVVMSWMAKAALAVSSKVAKRSTGSLLVRSVLRVEFSTGSSVSDHLIFRPRLNAIFDEGRSAEVEVRVSKRSISTGEEISMNVGYFYVSGAGTGTGPDIPFPPSKVASRLTRSEKAKEEAKWRRRTMLARRQLLSGLGDAIEWHPSLEHEAPALTIESVQRLARHDDDSVMWHQIAPTKESVTTIEWTQGEAWDRKGTFVLRASGVISKGSPSLEAVLNTLKSERQRWDAGFSSIEILEASKKDNETELEWDIALSKSLVPSSAGQTSSSGPNSLSSDHTMSFCYLRTWKIDSDEGTAILASQSVKHPKLESPDAQSRVRPSGWILRAVESGIEVTFIVERDAARWRETDADTAVEKLAETVGQVAEGWIHQLSALNFGSTEN